MKIAILFYHSVHDQAIHGLLDGLGCARFVELPRAWARDEGDRRFDTHVHPGTDSVVLAFVAEECAERLKGVVEEFRAGRAREHTHLAILPVEYFV